MTQYGSIGHFLSLTFLTLWPLGLRTICLCLYFYLNLFLSRSLTLSKVFIIEILQDLLRLLCTVRVQFSQNKILLRGVGRAFGIIIGKTQNTTHNIKTQTNCRISSTMAASRETSSEESSFCSIRKARSSIHKEQQLDMLDIRYLVMREM